MIPSRPRRLLVFAAAAAALLAACAGPPPPATVQVFTGPPQLPAGTTYRYERLPSQAGQAGQGELEAAADALLGRAGLRRDEAAPRLAVQLTGRQDTAGYGPWGYGGGPSVGVGIAGGSGGGGGVGIGLGFPIGGGVRPAQRMDVQIRDLASGTVVYQAQASGSAGTSRVALVQAALRDFPNARPGTRQVPLDDTAAR